MDHLFSFVKRPIRAILSALLATILTAAMVGGSAQSVSAASGKYFYWANMNIGGIGRAATTPPNTVTSQFIKPNDPGAPSYGLASDGVYIYWSELGDSMSFISRAPINNPTAVEKEFITVTEDKGSVYSIVISDKTIYWSATVDEDEVNGLIMKAPIDRPNEVEELARGVYATSLAIDSGQLYWINLNDEGESTPFIGRMSLSDKSDLEKSWFDTGFELVFGLAAKAGYVYWHNIERNSIGRVKASDHSVVNKEFISDVNDDDFYSGLALDAHAIYWTSNRLEDNEDEPEMIGSIKSAELAKPNVVRTVVDRISPSVPLVIAGGSKPASAPPAKKKQTLRKGATPKWIKKRGTTVINKRGATTRQGQPVKAKIGLRITRGEIRCATVKRGAKRKVTVRTYGACSFRLKVTYTAPGNSKYYKFAKTKTYRVKR